MNYTPPVFEPVVYVPAPNKDQVRNLLVHGIYAVSHETIPIPGGANHWCLYFRTSKHESVRVDMTPSHIQPSTVLSGGSKGNMIISYPQSPWSNSVTCVVSMSVCENLTVGFQLDYLIASNRHRYEFDGSGQGCRTWTSDQIHLLSNAGYMTGPVAEAHSAILLAYPSKTPVALARGAYY